MKNYYMWGIYEAEETIDEKIAALLAKRDISGNRKNARKLVKLIAQKKNIYVQNVHANYRTGYSIVTLMLEGK